MSVSPAGGSTAELESSTIEGNIIELDNMPTGGSTTGDGEITSEGKVNDDDSLMCAGGSCTESDGESAIAGGRSTSLVDMPIDGSEASLGVGSTAGGMLSRLGSLMCAGGRSTLSDDNISSPAGGSIASDGVGFSTAVGSETADEDTGVTAGGSDTPGHGSSVGSKFTPVSGSHMVSEIKR